MEHVEKRVKSAADKVSDELDENLKELLRCVVFAVILNSSLMSCAVRVISATRDDVEQQLSRSFLYRLTHQATVASNVSKHVQALDDAWRAFDVCIPCTFVSQAEPRLDVFLIDGMHHLSGEASRNPPEEDGPSGSVR